MAASTAAASSSKPKLQESMAATEPMAPSGLALFRPAMSGAEPSTGRSMRLIRRHPLSHLAGADQRHNLLIHQALLAVVGHRDETMVKAVQLLLREIVTQVLGALVERVPAAVFAQHQPAFGHAHRARVDDLVSGLLLEVAVLVDAGLVRQRVAAHDGLVGLRAKRDDG